MKKILIIEDDTIIRENTAELLELSGFEVFTASNGVKGVAAALEHIPDVIVCDIMMPELDGFGVLDRLSSDALTKSIPFIFLSAKTERSDIRKGMELGADDYLTKPFEETELLSAIESRMARTAILRDLAFKETAEAIKTESEISSIHQLKNYIDDNGRALHYKQGELIYKNGDHSNLVFLIEKGVVKTHSLDEQGKELITAIYKEDDFFGFTSFVDNSPYQEYASTLEDTQVVAIPKEELKTLLQQNHDLALELMHFLAENLQQAKKQLLEMAYGSVRRKTASTILKFAEKLNNGTHGKLHILRSDLASVAGMATETLIRTLSSFKKEGLIHIEDRTIKVLDMDGLRKIH
ncbi:response regulator [Arenibacter sp. GZD96]|uniref:response regulator n=1 Tax=Aurantibrevibacter litoralis TaxID=3106030 RepID=UPI002B00020A|nr:response regulator [Arenibacter sp. GZD-96]MEA1785185.1 response regulator [Arenibacter sp. GZD-96]